MYFAFDDDQLDLQRLAKSILRPVAGIESRFGDEAPDTTTWGRLSEAGLPGLMVPESHGGAGTSLVELGIVAREVGRALYDGPYLSTAVTSVHLALLSEEGEARSRILSAVSDGEIVAFFGRSADLKAHRDTSGWTISGSAPKVLRAEGFAHAVMLCDTPEGPTLFVGDAGSHFSVSKVDGFDLVRPLSSITVTNAPAEPMGHPGRGDEVTEAVEDVMRAILASEQVGAAEDCFERLLTHLREREVGGHPLGAYQAIQHRCADSFLALESSRAISDYALWAHSGRPEEFAARAAMAKAYCTETYAHVAKELVHLSGAMGMTWEHGAHLHLRHAKATGTMLGSAADHRELFLTRLESEMGRR